MHVLLIDNYDSFTYNLAQLLARSGLCTYDVALNDQINLEKVSSYDKILISPGPGLPSEAGITCEVIKTYAPTKSILGICLGHQAIAEVFGAKLFQMPTAQHGQRVENIVIDKEDKLFQGLPETFTTTLYHSWSVKADSLPSELKVISKASDGHIMGIKHRRFAVWGLQFHPESYGTEYGETIIGNWLSV